LEQVIVNLVVNARDAMAKGGRLTIRMHNVQVDSEASRELAISPGCFVVIEVIDTGTGMDAEVRSHLFEPFFTTKEKGRGTAWAFRQVTGL
jgi:signal transduction histidine kinase